MRCNWFRPRPQHRCEFWLNMVEWEIPWSEISKLCVTFRSVLFSSRERVDKSCERICKHKVSKHVKSAKDVLFGGFIKKLSPHHHLAPKFQKKCITKAVFTLNTLINIGVSSTRIRIRIGNSVWEFQIWGKNWTWSRNIPVTVRAKSKIG